MGSQLGETLRSQLGAGNVLELDLEVVTQLFTT